MYILYIFVVTYYLSTDSIKDFFFFKSLVKSLVIQLFSPVSPVTQEGLALEPVSSWSGLGLGGGGRVDRGGGGSVMYALRMGHPCSALVFPAW